MFSARRPSQTLDLPDLNSYMAINRLGYPRPYPRIESLLSPGLHGTCARPFASKAEFPLQFVLSVQPASINVVIGFVKEAPAGLAEGLFLVWSVNQVPDERISSIGQMLQVADCGGNRFIRQTVR